MESIESRVQALESRLARWRALSIVVALAAAAGAWAAARAFPPEAPPPTELRVSDEAHTAVLTPRGLELEAALGPKVSLSVDDGLVLGPVTLSHFGLTLRKDERTTALSSDSLVMSDGDAELVRLTSGPTSRGELSLGRPDASGAPSAVLRTDANASSLRLSQPGAGKASLSTMSKMSVLCAEPPGQSPACAELRDVARVARPR